MLSRINVLSLMIICFLCSCKTVTENKTIVENTSIEENESFLSEEFTDFYDRFHSDSLYQLEHIVFPLEGRTYDESNKPIAKSWTIENWVLHKPFNDMGGTFSRSYTEFGGIISEKIIDDRNISNMERRFSKINNKWHLIFYDPIHLTQD